MKFKTQVKILILMISLLSISAEAKNEKRVIAATCKTDQCLRMDMLMTNLNSTKEAYLKIGKSNKVSKEEIAWDVQQSKISNLVCSYQYRLAKKEENEKFLKFVTETYRLIGDSMSSSEIAQCFSLIYSSNKNLIKRLSDPLQLTKELESISLEGSPVSGGDVQ